MSTFSGESGTWWTAAPYLATTHRATPCANAGKQGWTTRSLPFRSERRGVGNSNWSPTARALILLDAITFFLSAAVCASTPHGQTERKSIFEPDTRPPLSAQTGRHRSGMDFFRESMTRASWCSRCLRDVSRKFENGNYAYLDLSQNQCVLNLTCMYYACIIECIKSRFSQFK